MAKKPSKTKIGRQTPTAKVFLSTRNSKYKEAVELYQKAYKDKKVFDWQINLLKPILSANSEKLWTHTKFGYSVPRRNGKNEVALIRELWGVLNGEHILHTAQLVPTAHVAWERLDDALEALGIERRSISAHGRELIEVKEHGGGRIYFKTRSAKSGLGEGYDLLVIDEAQEYRDEEESALKYTVSASKNPQTLLCGTPPTPYSAGTIFTKLRNATLQGERENTGWAEWGVDKQVDPTIRKYWYETNPSLGLLISERSIADELGGDPLDFNIQRLGFWIRYNQKSAVSRSEWEELQLEVMPEIEGQLFCGIKYGVDGERVAMSIAVKMKNDDVFLEAIDCRLVKDTNEWILDFLSKADVASVVIDGQAGQTILKNDMLSNNMVEPILPTVPQIIHANALFEKSIFTKSIKHLGQPALSQVVCNCEKRAIGSNGGFGYRSLLEGARIELMDSMILALWGLSTYEPPARQRISY